MTMQIEGTLKVVSPGFREAFGGPAATSRRPSCRETGMTPSSRNRSTSMRVGERSGVMQLGPAEREPVEEAAVTAGIDRQVRGQVEAVGGRRDRR